LFFAHLACEKILKAHVCRRTGDLAPRLHNLVRLAELSELAFEPTQLDALAELNVFNLAGRYPDAGPVDVMTAEANDLIERADGVRKWLTARL
jgi:HEPN domain-containing protein